MILQVPSHTTASITFTKVKVGITPIPPTLCIGNLLRTALRASLRPTKECTRTTLRAQGTLQRTLTTITEYVRDFGSADLPKALMACRTRGMCH